MFTTTTLTEIGARLVDHLYQHSHWARRCLRHTRYALVCAESGLCCTGWYFEHTAGCIAPDLPRGCSDCYAPPGSAHHFGCSWDWDAPGDLTDIETRFWPDAARWPGHAVDSDLDPQASADAGRIAA